MGISAQEEKVTLLPHLLLFSLGLCRVDAATHALIRVIFTLSTSSNAKCLLEAHILSHRRHGTALMDSPAQTLRQTPLSQGSDHAPYIKTAFT